MFLITLNLVKGLIGFLSMFLNRYYIVALRKLGPRRSKFIYLIFTFLYACCVMNSLSCTQS